jgi:DNA processing protein
MERFINAFNLVPEMGYRTLDKIWKHFGCWQYAWETGDLGDFLNAGLSEEMAARILKLRPVIDVDAELHRLWCGDIFTVSALSPEYPPLLKVIPSPPFLLYRKGAALNPLAPHIAVVGTRMPSQYGERFAFRIAEGIAQCGGTVVSGLAYGIDAIAHRAAVKNNLPTVAVLASGINRITPSGNSGLARQILEKGGTIISEYAGGPPSYKGRFLERNRLISGLCNATVVIEAKSRSGALITASHASKQNRDVYALMGDLDRPQAQGCLNLIDEARAMPITSVRWFLMEIGFDPDAQVIKSLSDDELLVLAAVRGKPLTADEMVSEIRMAPAELNVALTMLEMKNLVRKNAQMKWEGT